MKRRALIVYCDNTHSGKLPGSIHDNNNYVRFLQSKTGGLWDISEIQSLRNPTIAMVTREIGVFLNDADYTFMVFTGHGFIKLNGENRKKQHIELKDGDIPISSLKTNSKRQTLLIDACRGFYSPIKYRLEDFSMYEQFTGDSSDIQTREIFDTAIMKAEEGWSILFASSENQTALDTESGGAYLFSLLKASELWKQNDKLNSVLNLKSVHNLGSRYLNINFDTTQRPVMNREKRLVHFPFAVK